MPTISTAAAISPQATACAVSEPVGERSIGLRFFIAQFVAKAILGERMLSSRTIRQARAKTLSNTKPRVNDPVCCLIMPSTRGGKKPPSIQDFDLGQGVPSRESAPNLHLEFLEFFEKAVGLSHGFCIQLASIRFPAAWRGRNGAVAQLGERLICIQEVAGSIPTSSTSVVEPDRRHSPPDRRSIPWACSSAGRAHP